MAFRDPVIVKAILGGPNGRIAVAYYEWSDSWMQKLLIDWTLLDSEAAIAAFASRLDEAPISIARRTSISGAIRYAIPLFGRSPYEPTRKVLDISGDGSNNDGGLVTDMRYEALKEKIVINGLPIMNDRPNPFGFPNEADLDRYYLACVTGGPRSFVEVAHNFEDFPRAVRKKLLQEVADRRPAQRFRHRRLGPCGRHAARAGRAAAAARGRGLHQVRASGVRARLRRRREAQPRVLAASLRGFARLIAQGLRPLVMAVQHALPRVGGRRRVSPLPCTEGTMSKDKIVEHHTAAAEHHEHAAKHHREAAKHHGADAHEKAAHHAHSAHGHATHAEHHADEASKHHAEHHGTH